MVQRAGLVLYPGIPAVLHHLAIVPTNVTCPMGTAENQQSLVGFFLVAVNKMCWPVCFAGISFKSNLYRCTKHRLGR